MRHLLTLRDFTKTEILSILKRSAEMKALVRNNPHPNTKPFPDMRGKTLAMLFSKKSTRTRVSAESGWAHFGGQPLFLSKNDIQLGSGEPIKDTSIVISSMVDLIFARLGDHSEIEELAKHSSVPVINALTAKYHPMQILADLLTLYETYDPKFGNLNLKVAWVGDANNIVNSMIVTFPRMGIQMAVATPKKYELDPDIQQIAHASGTLLTHDPQEAVKDADVIITDTWVSMGQEAEFEQRMRDFKGFQVTEKMASGAKRDWKFMHCLPRKPYEVDDQVFYSPRSLVFQEAENRKYTAMAVFEFIHQKIGM